MLNPTVRLQIKLILILSLSYLMHITANDVRRSLPHVALKYVLIRFKVLNDLSLEQLVTGNVQSTSNNTRMSGYRLVACGSACDDQVG